MSDSAFAPLFSNGQSPSLFNVSQNSSSGVSGNGIDVEVHQQKLMQLQLQKQQQMAMANLHLQALSNPALAGNNNNGTLSPGTISPQSNSQLGNFSPVNESGVDVSRNASSAASPVNISGTTSGTSSLNTSLSSAENPNGQESSQLDPAALKLLNENDACDVSAVPVMNLGVSMAPLLLSNGQPGENGHPDENLNLAFTSSGQISSYDHMQHLGISSTNATSPFENLDANNVVSSVGLGLNGMPDKTSSPNASIANMSSIWSNPLTLQNGDPSMSPLTEEALLQALQAQQQQQQLAAWASQQGQASMNGIGSPAFSNPLSSGNVFNVNTGLQSSNNAQLQALQQQLVMQRRNQSMTAQAQAMHSGLHRSTSLQPSENL